MALIHALSYNCRVKKNISVIVLTYNSEKHISRCLKSIKGQLSRNDKIIVVDNCSKDKTLTVAGKFNGVQIIKNKKNFGFSRGVNTGIKHTNSEVVILINPDVVLRRGAIKNMLHCHRTTGAEIVGGKLVKMNGEIHGSYVKSPNLETLLFDYTNLRKIIPGDVFHKDHYYLFDRPPRIPKEVDAVSGAFMLISKKVLRIVKKFDSKFFMYLEDVDFCVRALKKGFNVVYCSTAIATHVGGASSKNKDKINHEAWYSSRSYYARKHFRHTANLFLQPIFGVDKFISQLWRILK